MAMKETMEALVGLNAELDAIILACADGKISIMDIKVQLAVLPKLREAFNGMDKIKDEFKASSPDDISLFVDALTETGMKMVAAFAAVSAIFGA